MSTLTVAVAEVLSENPDHEALVADLRASTDLTRPLLFRLPRSLFWSFTENQLTLIMKSFEKDLTDAEWVLIERYSGTYLPSSSPGEGPHLFEWPNVLPPQSRLDAFVFGGNSAMTTEDFKEVLPVDRRTVLPMFAAHLEATQLLGERPGDFFDWFCALASASDYGARDVSDCVEIIAKILRVLTEIGQAQMLSVSKIAALARNVAEVTSHRGLRALHVELLRAVRTRDVALLRLVAQETGRERPTAQC